MEKIDSSVVQQACLALLKPIAGFLMKCGMTWREFSAVSKAAFVAVASEDYGIKGRKTNVSRVSILTGINRKEVKRQRELLDMAVTLPAHKTTDATRVLSGWHQDREFTDKNGKPKVLPITGDERSFWSLCQRFGGDVAVSTMLKELKRVKAVEQTPDGQVRALQRYYMPVQFDSEWIANAGSVFGDLGTNINHNLTTSDDKPSRFLGRATNPTIDASAIPEFRVFVEEQGQAFLEKVDQWLTEHQATQDEATGENAVRLGVGLFTIQDDNK